MRAPCLAVVVVLAACQTSGNSAAVRPLSPREAPHGALVIVGGGPRPPEIRQRFVELAGGAGKANIVVFAMASEDGKTSGE